MTNLDSRPEQQPIEPGIGPVGLADRAADEAVHTGTRVALPAMDDAGSGWGWRGGWAAFSYE